MLITPNQKTKPIGTNDLVIDVLLFNKKQKINKPIIKVQVIGYFI